MGGRSSKHEGIEDETQYGENDPESDIEGLLIRGQRRCELAPPTGDILIDCIFVHLREVKFQEAAQEPGSKRRGRFILGHGCIQKA